MLKKRTPQKVPEAPEKVPEKAPEAPKKAPSIRTQDLSVANVRTYQLGYDMFLMKLTLEGVLDFEEPWISPQKNWTYFGFGVTMQFPAEGFFFLPKIVCPAQWPVHFPTGPRIVPPH